ncbi:hypothetical protein [Cohnella yongneupensis]|uniref:Uncharacterized protein n=1 Tax=Cohnella yongneupensis TaxID=425006 RepID=A0ABW0QYB6_9BACL
MAKIVSQFTVSDLHDEVNLFDENWTRTIGAGQVTYTATVDDAKITIATLEDDDYKPVAKLYFVTGSVVYVIGTAVYYPPHTTKPL